MHLWYDRQGNEITCQELERLFDDFSNVRVARTRVTTARGDHGLLGHTGGEVSTVWMGVNYQMGDGPPLIFETMATEYPSHGNTLIRTSTEGEVRAAHAAEVERLKSSVRCPQVEEIDDQLPPTDPETGNT